MTRTRRCYDSPLCSKAADAAYAKAQDEYKKEREQAAQAMKKLEAKAAEALRRERLEEQMGALEMPKLVEKLRGFNGNKDGLAVDVCCAGMMSRVQEDTKARTKAAVSGALHVIAGVMRNEANASNIVLLDNCCNALSSILKASGLQHAAAEARCLEGLATAMTTLERHGLNAIKLITHKNDEMRQKALADGVKESWLPQERSKAEPEKLLLRKQVKPSSEGG